MKEYSNKSGHPVFIISLLTLIVNDWVLKILIHNDLTGKLSDFAGLFAFPFLFSSLFPKKTKAIHIFTGILFMLWKSEFSQPLINFLNYAGLPVHRTIDYTDYVALLSLVASYFTLRKDTGLTLKPVLSTIIIVISCLAFMATTMAPRELRKYIEINKEYKFDFSKRELVSRLNMVQIEEIRELNKSSGQIDFNSETNTFHYEGQTDTLALILDNNMINENNTISFKTSFAEIHIKGDGETSILKLVSVYKVIPQFNDKDYRDKAVKQFERRVIKKIRNYR